MPKPKLSVVITTFNSERYIKEVVESVSFADEIIVVDNGSSDSTLKILSRFPVTIFHETNDPTHLNRSKNIGFSKASGDWILNLDSDETLEAGAEAEVGNAIESATVNGYEFPRKNIIFGKWIEHGLWYPDYQTRLFRNGKGKFADVHQHEKLVVEGQVGRLTSHIVHQNYQSVSQYLRKIETNYSTNEAEQLLASKHKLVWSDMLTFPVQDFLSNYFLRKAYRDGLHGLVLSILQAFYQFVVVAKAWEMQGFWQREITLKETEPIFVSLSSQLTHWLRVEQGKRRIRSTLKRLLSRKP